MANKKRCNGEGGLSKCIDTKTGKEYWKGSCIIGTDENNKPIRKFCRAKTQAECIAKLKKLKEMKGKPISLIDENITLQKFFKDWLFEQRISELSPSTIQRYTGIYNNYIKDSIIGISKVKDIRDYHLNKYYNFLLQEKNKTPDTIRIINKVLHSVFKYGIKEHLISENICKSAKLPELQKKEEVQVFTLEEQQLFINSIQDHPNKVAFLLCLNTGLRIGELLGLKWCDIDFEKSRLKVERSYKRVPNPDYDEKSKSSKTIIMELPPKTKNSIRTIPILPNELNLLKSHRKAQLETKFKYGQAYNDNDLIFTTDLGKPIDSRNLSRSFSETLKSIGIPHKKFHSLRHTYATRLFELDINAKTVSKLLGHSNISITLDIYTHVTEDEKLKSVEKLQYLFAK